MCAVCWRELFRLFRCFVPDEVALCYQRLSTTEHTRQTQLTHLNPSVLLSSSSQRLSNFRCISEKKRWEKEKRNAHYTLLCISSIFSTASLRRERKRGVRRDLCEEKRSKQVERSNNNNTRLSHTQGRNEHY